MSLTGNATTDKVLRGRINRLDTLCVNAYEIAVKNGFEGTEEEWLESLQGRGISNIRMEDVNDNIIINFDFTDGKTSSISFKKSVSANARIAEVELLASSWVGTESPYSQVVAIAGVTQYSQVDLKPSLEQLSIFHNKDLAFVTENDGGIVTVYAIGDKPTNDYTMQVSITEVTA
jgi:hypothetical protein